MVGMVFEYNFDPGLSVPTIDKRPNFDSRWFNYQIITVYLSGLVAVKTRNFPVKESVG